MVYGDSGYTGIEKRPEIAGDSQKSQIKYIINRRPSSVKTKVPYNGINWEKEIEHRKSATHCKVEHPFLIVKKYFGYIKVAYRGLAKNFSRFNMLFSCGNLLMAHRTGRAAELTMG